MKKSVFILFACLLACGVGAEPYSLEKCIEVALQNNNALRQTTNQYKAQQINYDQARQNLSPSLSGSIGQNWVFGRSIGADNVYHAQSSAQTSFNVSASLMLFDGLKVKFQIDEARSSRQASAADVEALQATIRMNITAMYLQVLLNKALLQESAVRLSDTQQKIDRAQGLIEAERLAAGEIYALQAQQAKEELTSVQAQGDYQLSLLNLAQAMELDSFATFDILVPDSTELVLPLLPTAEEVYGQALLHRPEVSSAQFKVQAATASLKAAKAAYSPVLSAGANVGTGYYNMYGVENNRFAQQLSDNVSSSVGLSLYVPLYTQMQTTNGVKRARLNLENAQLDLQQVKKDLLKEIDQAYYTALAAQSQHLSAQKATTASEEAFRYATSKYEGGKISVYEYYEAKNSYMQARSQQLQAQYNYLFKVRILQYYEGVL